MYRNRKTCNRNVPILVLVNKVGGFTITRPKDGVKTPCWFATNSDLLAITNSYTKISQFYGVVQQKLVLWSIIY